MKNNEKLRCIVTPPLFWYFKGLIFYAAFLLSVILLILLIIRGMKNKTKKRRVWDKKNKVSALWLATAIIFLISDYPFSSDYKLYIISLLVLSVLLIIDLLLAIKYSLFKVRKFYWLLLSLLLIISIAVSIINIPEGYRSWETEKKFKQVFEQTTKELPEPKEIIRKSPSSGYLSYKIAKSVEEVVNFYKNSLPALGWEFVDETKNEYNQILYYSKANEEKCIRLNFDLYATQQEFAPETSLIIYVYNTSSCSPSDVSSIEIINPLGPCGNNPWF